MAEDASSVTLESRRGDAKTALRTLFDHHVRVTRVASRTIVSGHTHELRAALCERGFRWSPREKHWSSNGAVDLLELLPALAIELTNIEAMQPSAVVPVASIAQRSR